MEDTGKERERKENKIKKGIEKALWSKHSMDKIYYYYSNTFYHSSVPFSGRRCQLGQNRCKAGSLYNVDSCLIGSELQPSNEFQLDAQFCPWNIRRLCDSASYVHLPGKAFYTALGLSRLCQDPLPSFGWFTAPLWKQIQGGKYKHYRVSVEWLYKRSMPAPTFSATSLQQKEHWHISISMLHASDVRSKLEDVGHSPNTMTKHYQLPWGLEEVIIEMDSWKTEWNLASSSYHRAGRILTLTVLLLEPGVWREPQSFSNMKVVIIYTDIRHETAEFRIQRESSWVSWGLRKKYFFSRIQMAPKSQGQDCQATSWWAAAMISVK